MKESADPGRTVKDSSAVYEGGEHARLTFSQFPWPPALQLMHSLLMFTE